MAITVILQDEKGATLASEEIGDVSDPTVVMMKRDANGQLVVGSFELLEIDKHPDTLRQIGGYIVDFAERS